MLSTVSCRAASLQSPEWQAPRLPLYTPYIDNWGELIIPEGHGVPQLDDNSGSSWDRVSTGYLKPWASRSCAAAASLTRHSHTRSIAVVSEAFAKRFFPNQDPIGKHFGLDLP